MSEKTKDSEEEKPPVQKPIFDNLGPGVPSFENYFNSKLEYIKTVQTMMAKSLSDDSVEMDRQARECEAEFVSMKSILSFADAYLDIAEHLSLTKMPSRDKNFTDMDRETALAAAVVRERRFRNVVKGITEGMDKRISYTQSHLRAFVTAEGQKYSR